MAFEIHIHEENIVFIRLHGQSDLEENEQARGEVMQLCHDTGIRSVLADCQELEVPSSITTVDLYNFGKTWDKNLVSRLAIVLPNNERNRGHIRFSETVAYNRGLNTRTFDKLKEALSWLYELDGHDRSTASESSGLC
ncbi:MAG: hypothetical protein JSU59_04555 [Nitrospirota bacterium]|nr:MAG: hypothetical protein JSU59_04555 [Nitrospirota bacterium]